LIPAEKGFSTNFPPSHGRKRRGSNANRAPAGRDLFGGCGDDADAGVGRVGDVAATFTVGNGTQLDSTLGLVSPGDTIVLKSGTYLTVDASTPANGFEIAVDNVTIRGQTTSGGKCQKTATTIVDGDNPPATGPPARATMHGR
jgi:hypothetical protein